MKIRNILLIMLIALSIVGCKKDPKDSKVELLLTKEVVEERITTATIEAEYSFPSVMKNIMVHCSENEDMSDEKTVSAVISEYSFSADLTDLKGETLYYYYYEYSNGLATKKSETKQFKTKEYGMPTVETGEISEITATSAKCGGSWLTEVALM